MSTCCLCIPSKMGFFVLGIFGLIDGVARCLQIYNAIQIGGSDMWITIILALPIVYVGIQCVKYLFNEDRGAMAAGCFVWFLLALIGGIASVILLKYYGRRVGIMAM